MLSVWRWHFKPLCWGDLPASKAQGAKGSVWTLGVREAERKMTPEGARAGSQTAANAVLCGCCLELCVQAELSPGLGAWPL